VIDCINGCNTSDRFRMLFNASGTAAIDVLNPVLFYLEMKFLLIPTIFLRLPLDLISSPRYSEHDRPWVLRKSARTRPLHYLIRPLADKHRLNEAPFPFVRNVHANLKPVSANHRYSRRIWSAASSILLVDHVLFLALARFDQVAPKNESYCLLLTRKNKAKPFWITNDSFSFLFFNPLPYLLLHDFYGILVFKIWILFQIAHALGIIVFMILRRGWVRQCDCATVSRPAGQPIARIDSSQVCTFVPLIFRSIAPSPRRKSSSSRYWFACASCRFFIFASVRAIAQSRQIMRIEISKR